MKTLIVTILSLISLNAFAGLSCEINEPFMGLDYDPGTRVLSYGSGDEGGPTVVKGVTLVRIGSVKVDEVGVRANVYVLRSTRGKTLAKLTLTFNANDGMSDLIFPYRLEFQGYVGVCESDTFKRRCGSPEGCEGMEMGE